MPLIIHLTKKIFKYWQLSILNGGIHTHLPANDSEDILHALKCPELMELPAINAIAGIAYNFFSASHYLLLRY